MPALLSASAVAPSARGLLALLALSVAGVAQAQTTPAAEGEAPAALATPSNPFRLSIGGGYAHQFATDVEDAPGEVSIDRAYASLSSTFGLNEDLSLGVRLAWEGGWYDFDGANPLAIGGVSPWKAVHGIQLGARLNWTLDAQWSVGVGVFGSAAGESDADVGDALTFGGSVSGAWRANDRFTIGAGILASTQIEEDALIIPLLIIDWRITDAIRLSNVTGPEAYPTGAGLELSCTALEGFDFGIGGRWESRRFRLDDEGPAPEGVGEDEGLGLWLRAGIRPTDALRIDLLAGLMLGEELELDDRDGNTIASIELDPSPFVGAFVSFRF
jgi:hypothetical protein